MTDRAAASLPFAPDRALTPRLIVCEGWEEFALLDCGQGRKLERYGPYLVDRPEPQAMGTRRLGPEVWDSADAVFTGASEKGDDDKGDDRGRWRFKDRDLSTWKTGYGGARFFGRFTPFRHMGFFPEQAPHWDFMAERLRAHRAATGEAPRLLNLFGYTGVGSLIAAAAGAEVTHVDASKKAVGFAKENQDLSDLGEAPVRWIVDDAVKFAAREVRRGRTYHGILVDPPKFGRGPKNEVWNLFDDLPEMLRLCRDLLAAEDPFLILTAYAVRASFLSMYELCAEIFEGHPLSCGELALREEVEPGARARLLSTSLFVRVGEA